MTAKAASGAVPCMLMSKEQYIVSKHIRKDNTPKMARYLGYINTRELYPDFARISFSQYIDELLAGKGKRPYAGRF
jgi:hypothetical protein